VGRVSELGRLDSAVPRTLRASQLHLNEQPPDLQKRCYTPIAATSVAGNLPKVIAYSRSKRRSVRPWEHLGSVCKVLEVAKEVTGDNRAHELQDQAHERLTAAIEATAETRAITMEGLRCKARASAKI
jgi:hypothetical protein